MEGHTTPRAVGLALALAVATYVGALTTMHAFVGRDRAETLGGALVAIGAVATGAVGLPVGTTVLLLGLLLAAAVVHSVLIQRREDPVSSPQADPAELGPALP